MRNAVIHRLTGWAAAVAMLIGTPALAQQITIGVSAPLSGNTAILGEQVSNGARVAAKALGVEVHVEDDACSAEGGAKAANAFVERKVAAVIGYLCSESLETALPILKDAGIPAITIGVRANALTDHRAKTGWPIFRLTPRGDGESEAVAQIIPKLWLDTPFAIIDDGAIYNRDLAESLRLAATDAGLTPVLVDGYRPGLERQTATIKKLKDAGAKAVFVSGDAADIAVIAADAAKAKLDIRIAGGETLGGTAEIPVGTIMIGLPVWRDIATAQALATLETAGVLPDGYVLPTYAAVQVVADAAKGDAALPVAERIQALAAETAIGPVRFDAKGDVMPSPYGVYTFDGRRFVRTESE